MQEPPPSAPASNALSAEAQLLEEPGLPGFAPPPQAAAAPAPGSRLARKYRPSSFDDLIGQDPMVRTLRNAFARTPVSIQACGMRLRAKALRKVRTIGSWPIRSSKLDGRYFRASTR